MANQRSAETATKVGDLCISVKQDRGWTELFRRYDGWTGADGIYAIPLSGHESPGKAAETRNLFVFSDSFIGKVDTQTQVRHDFRMVNNTLALLDGGFPDPDHIRFLWERDDDGNPRSMFVPDTPMTRDQNCWYWLQDGVALGQNVYILPMVIVSNPTGSEGFKFKLHSISLLRIPLGTHGPALEKHTQCDTPLLHKSAGHTLYFGAGIMPNTEQAGAPDPDGYVYVYGRYEAQHEVQLAVARMKPSEFEQLNAWRFWDGRMWSPNIEDTAPLGRGGPELSVTPMTAGPLKGKYLMVSMHVERNLYIRIGESPVGPFGPRIDIYHTEEPDTGQSIYTYNAKAHPSLSEPDELLISYNVNSTNWHHLTHNADIYRPRFLRVRFAGTHRSP